MKIGLTTYSLSRLVSKGEFTLCDIIRWGAENGAEHIEIAPGKENLAENEALCAEIRKTAADCGVDLSSYTIGANFIQPDEEAFRKEIERVKREVDVAVRLGVARMRHDAGWRPPAEATCRNFDADLPKLAEACAEIHFKPLQACLRFRRQGVIADVRKRCRQPAARHMAIGFADDKFFNCPRRAAHKKVVGGLVRDCDTPA